jgi:hypothetical protein
MNLVVRIGGIVLLVFGALAMVLSLLSPGAVFEDLGLDTAALLLAGGLVTLGLSSLTEAVETLRSLMTGEDHPVAGCEEAGGFASPSAEPLRTAAGNGAGPPRAKPSEEAVRHEPEIAPPVAENENQAEDRISIMKEKSRPTIEAVAEEVTDFSADRIVEEIPVSEEELYVVEERTIAGKPARILSDGTVEAETDDGWMRFENVEHLEEYMEAVRAQRG